MPADAPTLVPLADALRNSESLARLAQRLRESRRRFECIETLLPSALAAQAEAGPLDEHGWTLLALTPAAAAKLRQLVPLIEARLTEQGFGSLAIRVRVR